MTKFRNESAVNTVEIIAVEFCNNYPNIVPRIELSQNRAAQFRPDWLRPVCKHSHAILSSIDHLNYLTASY
jgi:hypothetical protein